jgi:hypothetical protein
LKNFFNNQDKVYEGYDQLTGNLKEEMENILYPGKVMFDIPEDYNFYKQ